MMALYHCIKLPHMTVQISRLIWIPYPCGMISWQMVLNPAKCEALCITNKLSSPVFQYEFKVHPIKWVSSVIYLGVTISPNLKWNSHCYLRAGRLATRIFNILRQTMFGCSTTAKSWAFQSLVLPMLVHTSPVWSPYTKQNIDLLESVLHRGAWWACGSCFDSSTYHWSPSVSECCDRLKWHSLATHGHRDITCLLLTHDIIHNDSCPLQHKLSIFLRLARLQCQSSSINTFRYSYL